MDEAINRLRKTAGSLAELVQSVTLESWAHHELCTEIGSLLELADRLEKLKTKKEAA